MVANDEALLSICFKTADMLMKKQVAYDQLPAGVSIANGRRMVKK